MGTGLHTTRYGARGPRSEGPARARARERSSGRYAQVGGIAYAHRAEIKNNMRAASSRKIRAPDTSPAAADYLYLAWPAAAIFACGRSAWLGVCSRPADATAAAGHR